MSNLAIIPARGGSKRIPGKNIRNFLGQPIISYSIRAALDSGLFDEVMVSTDDEEIARCAIEYGAKVPFMRSSGNSDDHATTLDVLEEVLESYHQRNRVFENLCCIYATAPLIAVNDLKNGYRKLVSGGYDSLFPVVEFDFPIWRSLRLEKDRLQMVWPENKSTRSQDLPAAYHDAGQWYWLNCKQVPLSILGENTGTLILENGKVQDIDTETDWKLAEIKFQLINNHE